jgi:hypothetical protein
VSDIWVVGNDVAIATHGRGFYILDSVGPLRQYGSPAVTATDAYLFKPGNVVRQAGMANIYYWLKKPAQKLTLEILDSKGQVVRSFDGALPKPDAATGAAGRGAAPAATPAGAGGAAAPTAPAALVPANAELPPDDDEEGAARRGPPTAPMVAGLQRFTWDQQYQPVVTFTGMVLWGATTNGPTALPGDYQARLTVDGQVQTQSFAIEKNPRRSVSDADLEEQFALASRIRDKVNEANNAIIQLRHIKQQLDDRLKQTDSADVKAIAEQFARELTLVEVDVYQVRNQSNQDPLNFPIKTNNRLASLLRVVEAGDGKPVGNAVPIFNELQAELNAETARLQRAITTYVPRFNQLAQRLGIQPITEK